MWALDLKIAPNDKHLIELFGGEVISNRGWFPVVIIEGSYDLTMKYFNYGAPGIDQTNVNLGFAGLAYTGNIADMIDIKAEYSVIFGKMHSSPPLFGAAGEDDEISMGGWNVYLDVAYHNDLLRVGLAFLMGSGAKHDWGFTSLRHVNITNIREDNFWWANIIGNGYGGTNSVYIGPGFGGRAENLTSVKLYFEISPMEKLTLNAAVIWAKWTDPIGSGPNVANEMPAYPHPANWYSNYGPAFASWDASTDLGWEIDFGFNYEIMEGLDYTFGAGVLFTGDSWDYIGVTGEREDWGAIWSISNVLRYSF
jgi:hypothetical protein